MSNEDREINYLTWQYKDALQAKKQAEENLAKASHDLIAALDLRGKRTAHAFLPEGKFKVRVVITERTKIDSEGLKKALGAKVFNTLCVQQLDNAKLADAMHKGTVDSVVVAQHTEIKKAAPYVRLTEENRDE